MTALGLHNRRITALAESGPAQDNCGTLTAWHHDTRSNEGCCANWDSLGPLLLFVGDPGDSLPQRVHWEAEKSAQVCGPAS